VNLNGMADCLWDYSFLLLTSKLKLGYELPPFYFREIALNPER
jgi:hypothetical protein